MAGQLGYVSFDSVPGELLLEFECQLLEVKRLFPSGGSDIRWIMRFGRKIRKTGVKRTPHAEGVLMSSATGVPFGGSRLTGLETKGYGRNG